MSGNAVTTPTDLIRLILRTAQVNGVGQTPTAEDNNDMLLQLNLLLPQWSAQRTLVYHLVNSTVTATGASSYTVGTGGDFSTTRPDKIDAAFYTYTPSGGQATDYILTPIGSREEWDAVVNKGVGTWPGWFFYDSGYPLGTFYPYPIPQTGSLTISTKAVLTQFADLTSTITFPPAYLNALLWNGASIARIMYALPPDDNIDKRAAGALGVIRASNTQIPQLRMPVGMPGIRTRYNVYSDTGAR